MSQYRFTLTDNNGIVKFGSEKVRNWDEIESNLTRSKSYRGRVRKVTSSFDFVKEIRTQIMTLYANYGTNADLKLLIEVGDDNLDEFSFTQLGSGFPLQADFNTYNVTENGVQLNFLDSDFQELISAGEKEKLNITTDTTLVGTTPTDYKTLLKSIYMHDRTLELNSRYDYADVELSNSLINQDDLFMNVPMSVKYKSDDDIKQIITIDTYDPNDPLLYFLLQASEDKPGVFDISFDFDYSLAYNVTGGTGDLSVAVVFRVIDADNNAKVLDALAIATYIDGQTTNNNFTYSGTKSVDLEEGDSVGIFITHIKPSAISFTLINREISNKGGDQFLFINETSYFDATISNCLRPHDFFTHWVELMTGRKSAFYSDYFGLTELGYAQDGEGAYLSLMDGYMIRNMPIEEKPFNTSFKSVLENFIKEKNLVAQVEYIGDAEVFRIEKYEDVFKTEVKGDLGELVTDVELSINEDLTFGSVRVGSDDIELEDLNGLNSPQGEVNYSLPIVSENELDLVTTWIKNSYPIEQQRRLQYSIAPEESGKYDKDIFLVDGQKGATTDVLAVTDQGYTSIEGILAPDKAYNLNLTPAKQFVLWGNVINGCLQKDQSKTIVLTKSASNNILVTVKDGITVDEGANVLVSDLAPALITNEKILIGDAALEKELYDTIEEFPNNQFQFTNKGITYYFYIEKNNYNVSEKKGNFELNKSSR